MPKLYMYLGIIIKFYSKEHEPIHIHALYGINEIKIEFFIEDNEIYWLEMKNIKGKFPKSKEKELKKLIHVYKNDIVKKWNDYFLHEKKIKCININKKL